MYVQNMVSERSRMKSKSTTQASGAKCIHKQWVCPEGREVACDQGFNQFGCERLISHGMQILGDILHCKLPGQVQWDCHLCCHHSELPEWYTNVLQATGICHGVA